MRRLGLMGVLLVLLVTGCTSLVMLSGPRTLAPGDTATYVLSLDGPGVDNATLYIACDVPASWALVSNSYTGTIAGLPATGSATVIPDPFPTVLPPPGNGNQRIWLEEGPFDIAPDDSAQLTLEFDVVDVPPGEFVLKFWFLASPDVMSSAHTHAAVTVNREPRLFGFVRALFEPDGALFEATSVAPSPDGRSVVQGGYGDLEPVLSVFDRDGLTGELSHNHGVNSGGGITGFEDVVFAPGSHHLYGCGSGFLAGFEHDPVSGQLSLIQVLLAGSGGHQPLGGARGIDLSPNGEHLYVAASLNEVVSIFSRDESTGVLTYVTYAWHEELHEPVALAVSPDGAHVYVVNPSYSTLVVFDRDQQTGELVFRQFVQHGVGGVEDMFFPQDVVVSSDGTHVYVTGYESDSVAWFERNPTTGELLFLGSASEGSGDVVGILGPLGLALSPDDRHLFVAGLHSLVVFRRDPLTGALAFLRADFEGEGGVTGISYPTRPAISHDGGDVYAPGFWSMAVFSPRLFADGLESGGTSRWSTVTP